MVVVLGGFPGVWWVESMSLQGTQRLGGGLRVTGPQPGPNPSACSFPEDFFSGKNKIHFILFIHQLGDDEWRVWGTVKMGDRGGPWSLP